MFDNKDFKVKVGLAEMPGAWCPTPTKVGVGCIGWLKSPSNL